METSNEKSIGSLIHLSTLSQYLIPFGNYLFPLLIWSSSKDKSTFIDNNGKQALNFQLSILMYSLVALVIAIPTCLFWFIGLLEKLDVSEHHISIKQVLTTENYTGFVILGVVTLILFAFLKISEFFLIIYASVKSANGELYKYPLTINFIK